nr:hypothetical protein [Nitrosococcus oceani]
MKTLPTLPCLCCKGATSARAAFARPALFQPDEQPRDREQGNQQPHPTDEKPVGQPEHQARMQGVKPMGDGVAVILAPGQ